MTILETTFLKFLRSKNVTILNSTHDPEKFLDVDSHFHIEIENEKEKNY